MTVIIFKIYFVNYQSSEEKLCFKLCIYGQLNSHHGKWQDWRDIVIVSRSYGVFLSICMQVACTPKCHQFLFDMSQYKPVMNSSWLWAMNISHAMHWSLFWPDQSHIQAALIWCSVNLTHPVFHGVFMSEWVIKFNLLRPSDAYMHLII